MKCESGMDGKSSLLVTNGGKGDRHHTVECLAGGSGPQEPGSGA